MYLEPLFNYVVVEKDAEKEVTSGVSLFQIIQKKNHQQVLLLKLDQVL